MSSIIEICNLALSNIGKDNISALDEAGAEARACRQFYATTRDLLLQGYPWRFAGKSASMAEVEAPVATRWAHVYARPNDCLKIRYVRRDYPAGEDVLDTRQDEIQTPYEVDGGLIYCNLSPAILHYTRRVEDPSLFSPLFVEALAWHLAVRLSMPLTRDPKMRADAYQLAQIAAVAAELADANEARESSDHESEYNGVRG